MVSPPVDSSVSCLSLSTSNVSHTHGTVQWVAFSATVGKGTVSLDIAVSKDIVLLDEYWVNHWACSMVQCEKVWNWPKLSVTLLLNVRQKRREDVYGTSQLSKRCRNKNCKPVNKVVIPTTAMKQDTGFEPWCIHKYTKYFYKCIWKSIMMFYMKSKIHFHLPPWFHSVKTKPTKYLSSILSSK